MISTVYRYNLYRYVVVFLVFLLVAATSVHASECPPAEDGKPYSISCMVTYSTNDRYLYWHVYIPAVDDYNNVVRCNRSSCISYYSTYFSATIEDMGGTYKSILNITKIDIHIGGFICSNEVIFGQTSCSPLKVYSKPENVTCTELPSQHVESDFVIECKTDRIYPEPECAVVSGVPNTSFEYQIKNLTEVNSTRRIFYYSATCRVTFPASSLRLGQNEIIVNMFPNVTGRERLGVNSSVVEINVSLPTADVDVACLNQNRFPKNSTITCTCVQTSPGNPPGSVQWFHENGSVVTATAGVNKSLTLTVEYQDNADEQIFRCRGVSALGQQYPGVIFKPNFQIGAFVINFTADTSTGQMTTGKVKLICFAGGNPLPTMTISRKHSKYVEATVSNTKNLSLSIPNVKCEDIDEYVCDADNGVVTTRETSKTFRLFINCSINLQAGEADYPKYPVIKGRDVFVKVNVFGYPNPSSYSLKYLIQGSPYEIRQQRYTVVYTETTPFYGSANLAIFGIQEQDFTQFIFTISNGVGDRLDFHFTVQEEQESSDNSLALGLGLGISLPLLTLGIVSVVLAVIIRKRRSLSSRDPKPANYDDVIVTQTDEHRYGVINQTTNIYDLPDLNNEQPQPMTNNYSNVSRLGDSNLNAQKNPDTTFGNIKTQSGNKATAQMKLNYENIEIEEKC